MKSKTPTVAWEQQETAAPVQPTIKEPPSVKGTAASWIATLFVLFWQFSVFTLFIILFRGGSQEFEEELRDTDRFKYLVWVTGCLAGTFISLPIAWMFSHWATVKKSSAAESLVPQNPMAKKNEKAKKVKKLEERTFGELMDFQFLMIQLVLIGAGVAVFGFALAHLATGKDWGWSMLNAVAMLGASGIIYLIRHNDAETV